MSLNYKIKKSWYGFRQKYKLGTQFKIASKLLLIFLIIWLAGSALTILSQWGYTDHFEGSPFQGKYLKYFWPVIIELVSGYDIGNIHLNPISNIIAVIVVITGIVMFAVFTGQIVSLFIHMLHRINFLPEKPDNFAFNRPIVICGINNKLDRIVEELRKNCLSNAREIVIIDSNADTLKIEDKALYKDVWYVKGNRADRKVLQKVLGEDEASAIILASNSPESTGKKCGRYSDSGAIETAMAIEGYKEKTHTVVELTDDRNIPHLEHTKINEWISIYEYGIKLTAQAALQHGMGSVYHYLLGGNAAPLERRKTSQIFLTQNRLPQKFNGLTYKEIRDKILSKPNADITLLGFARYVPGGRSPFIKQLNPVNRRCKHCGEDIRETDELGRIQKKCTACFTKEKQGNNDACNPWYFPMDTRLERDDQLIYLSEKPMDFNKVSFKNGRRPQPIGESV